MPAALASTDDGRRWDRPREAGKGGSMRSKRTIAFAIASATLAIGTLTGPAAAQPPDPRLAFVNGIPGEVVEVCIGDNEVRPRLRYGRSFDRSVAPGDRIVRFREASPGECNGDLLARRRFVGANALVPTDDLTLVGTRRQPKKVVVFDNRLDTVDFDPPIGPAAWRAIRHAADVGNVVITEEEIDYEGPEAAVTPERWQKGDQEVESGAAIEGAGLIAAGKPGRARPFVGPNQYNFRDGRRTEIILVGTTLRNARFALIDRPTIAP